MKRRLGEKLAACLLAFAVAAPMCYVMQHSLGIWISGWYALLFAAASLLLIELVAWNRVTAIAAPAGLLLASGFVWLVAGEDGREALTDFFWWAMGFIARADAYPLGYGIALAAIASFLVTLFIWLFGRKFFCFPVVFASVVAFVLWKWLCGMDSVLVPGAIACGGLVPLWAKSWQRKTAKKEKKALPENGIALFLLPVAALMVLVSLSSVTTESARSWQSRQVYDLFERVNNFMADYTNFNRPRNAYSIASYGFMPMGNRLGGPIKPSDVPVMNVSAPRSMLLRGTIYNNYTGSKWTDTTNSDPRRLNGAEKALSDNAFDLNRPALSGVAQADYNRFIEQITISINPLINSSSTIFVPSRGVTAITSDKLFAIMPKFNAKGEAFNTFDIRAGYSYKVKADNLVYNADGFDAMIGYLMDMRPTDSQEQENYIKSNYLALPEGIDSGVYKLTEDIVSGKPVETIVSEEARGVIIYSLNGTSGGGLTWSGRAPENDYEKALAIKEFLSKNYAYTLSPGTPDENADFVSYFLEREPQGYCTYFASSMAVMARIAGIPSRYVEGYLMPGQPGDGGVYEVTGENAHAWAELYFAGIGWIPFDATPSGESQGPASGDSGFVPPIPEPTHPTGNNGDAGNEDTTGKKSLTWEEISQYVWTLPAGLAAAALLWAAAKMALYKVRTSKRNVLRRYKDLGRCCAFYYADTLKLLEYYNYPVKRGETPYAYAARIDKWLRLESGTFAQAANLISLLSYSNYGATDADVEFMARFRAALAKYTYHTVGPWYYLWTQVLGFGRKPATPAKDR